MSTLLKTITYASAPAVGVQSATIVKDEEGTHVWLHFLEVRYNYTTCQDEVTTYDYHAWATDQERHTEADILQCAKDMLGKYACRAGYYGKMEYTIVDAPTVVAETPAYGVAFEINTPCWEGDHTSYVWQKNRSYEVIVGETAQFYKMATINLHAKPVVKRVKKTNVRFLATAEEVVVATPVADQPLLLSVVCHADSLANNGAIMVPTSLYYADGQVNLEQVQLELSAEEVEPLATGSNWVAYVRANAADYPHVKLNPLAADCLTKLTGFDWAEAGGVFGPVLLLKTND